MSAHGPLIINLTLCAGRLIILTYLYDSDLTSSPGLCFLSPFSLYRSHFVRLVVWNSQQESRKQNLQHQSETKL